MDSTEQPVSIPPQDDLTEVRKPTSLLVAQFFLFPLVIIAFGVGIFVLFGAIAFDQKSPEAYLAEVRAGSGYVFDSRRWQAAWELGSVIASRREELKDSPFAAELLRTYVESKPPADATLSEQDWKLRLYLAASLGKLGNPEFVPALVDGLSDASAETQIYTLRALGEIGDPVAGTEVARMLGSDDPGVRTVAAYVLGFLQNPDTLPALRIALNDTAVDVRWNAAIALAQMDDRSGADLLLQLADREYLARFPEMSEAARDDTMINAITSLARLRLDRARDHLVSLSRNDPSTAVRSAALLALEVL